MKISRLFSFLALFLAAPAFAGNITLSVGETGYLSDCGGRVTANANGDQLNFVFESVKYCKTFDILKANGEMAQYEANKLDEQRGGYFGGSRTIPKRFMEDGRNTITVLLRSKSGAHSDKITVRYRVESDQGDAGSVSRMRIWLGQEKRLQSCGGSIRITDSRASGGGEQLNMVMSDVRNCSNFDILSANGDTVRQREMKLQERSNGTRGGSFTLKRSLIEDGTNSIQVVVQSKPKQTRDIITIYFYAE